MILRFTIKGFKRFTEEIALDLNSITVLVGANNSGKSTILQALTLFQYCINSIYDKKEHTLVQKNFRPGELFGPLPVVNYTDLFPNGNSGESIKLGAELDNGTNVDLEIAVDNNGRFVVTPKVSGDLPTDVMNRAIRLIPVFSSFKPKEPVMDEARRKDAMRMQRHGEIVRNLLWDLCQQDEERWELLCELLRELFPGSTLSVCKKKKNNELSVNRTDDVLHEKLDMITAGAGFHQTLQILASTLAPGAGTILLDEPDTHLHAQRQGELMETLKRLAKDLGLQFILATHSPQIIKAAPSPSLRVCNNGKVVSFNPYERELLDSLGVTDRMGFVPLLRNRVIVFVEGEDDERFLKLFADKYWGEQKRKEIWDRLTILRANGSPANTPVVIVARHLRVILEKVVKEKEIRVVAVSDRDHRTDDSRCRAIHNLSLNEENVNVELYMWRAKEIENYFLNQEAITHVLAETNSGEEAQWKDKSSAFAEEFERLISEQREKVQISIANRIQQETRGIALNTAMEQASKFIGDKWNCSPTQWCSAKDVLTSLRSWLETQGLKRFLDAEVIKAMQEVPDDVKTLLTLLEKHVTEE